jgi:hypothetical protein
MELLDDAVRRISAATEARIPTGRSHDDGDGVVGSIATDSAIGFDPRPVLRALSDQGAEVVVMGQVAAILHGSAELTGDLDLLWDGDKRQAPRLAAAFAQVAAQLTDDDGSPVPCEPATFHLPKLYFKTTWASGDCCTAKLPWGELDIKAILARAETMVHEGYTLRYVAVSDLMVMRSAVGRPKDLRRNIELSGLIGPPSR